MTATVRHPIVWTILYVPFGAMQGFVGVAVTYIASAHGISVTQTAFIAAAALVSQWLKWIWAPAVDVTLTPKTWYGIGLFASAAGVFGICVAPMTQANLPALLAVITIASLMRSFLGMAIEAMVAQATPAEEQGRTGGWFQIGNLGGAGIGGGLGLVLLERLAEPWMAGAILAGVFLACALALYAVPHIDAHRAPGGPLAAMRGVLGDLGGLAKTKGGLYVTLLSFLPFGTAAAGAVLNQAQVAQHWRASANAVALTSGFLSTGVTAVGCLVGGWCATRWRPRPAYLALVVINAAVSIAMAIAPPTPAVYVAGSLAYSFAVGMVFASWTAAVLATMGVRSAATKYTLYASLSNFPAWWLGLVLGVVADAYGAAAMLLAEGFIAIAAVGVFAGLARAIHASKLPGELAET